MNNPYPIEEPVKDKWGGCGYWQPGSEYMHEDDGTMPENVEKLAEHVVGHKIVSAQRERDESANRWWGDCNPFVITLDNGVKVALAATSDCCAYTDLVSFLLNVDKIDHVITGVGTTDGYTKWHVYADMGDVLELTVGWSAGNPFYYGYGFDIYVVGEERESRW